MDCKVGYVYVHINKINGKAYVGQTIQKPEKRWKKGKRYLELKNGNFIQPKFAKAILKYGWNNFDHIILYKGCPAMLDLLEEMYIKKYNSINNGYNLTSGGIKFKLSKESQLKATQSRYKKVRCLENGKIFGSVMSAAEYININKHAMSACCRGKTHTCGGYHWEYI